MAHENLDCANLARLMTGLTTFDEECSLSELTLLSGPDFAAVSSLALQAIYHSLVSDTRLACLVITPEAQSLLEKLNMAYGDVAWSDVNDLENLETEAILRRARETSESDPWRRMDIARLRGMADCDGVCGSYINAKLPVHLANIGKRLHESTNSRGIVVFIQDFDELPLRRRYSTLWNQQFDRVGTLIGLRCLLKLKCDAPVLVLAAVRPDVHPWDRSYLVSKATNILELRSREESIGAPDGWQEFTLEIAKSDQVLERREHLVWYNSNRSIFIDAGANEQLVSRTNGRISR